MTFKPGDKVVCVDSEGTTLEWNKMYQISDFKSEKVVLVSGLGRSGDFEGGRFRLATEEEIEGESLNETYDGIIAQGHEDWQEEQDYATAFVNDLHSRIPDCLINKNWSLPSCLDKVVTMALCWQSAKPHAGGCNEGEPVWHTKDVGERGALPIHLYYNLRRVGALQAQVADGIVDALNAAVGPGPYCPTCKAQAELKKREEDDKQDG